MGLVWGPNMGNSGTVFLRENIGYLLLLSPDSKIIKVSLSLEKKNDSKKKTKRAKRKSVQVKTPSITTF